MHTHVNGPRAAEVFGEVMDLYGVRLTFSQTRLSDADAVRNALGDRIRFIAIPDYMSEDKSAAFTDGFLNDIETWHERFGAKMVKFWSAPRLRDYAGDTYAEMGAFDSLWKIRQAELAHSLGMMFMVHVADPDTWFRTTYADTSKYGTKLQQYEPLERMLDRFSDTPWMAAHMGGWPEDLAFLDGLLTRHPNLSLDTSATKWQVRELSRHTRNDLVAFLTKWRGRILFGSDIVTSDEHMQPSEPVEGRPVFGLASSPDEAFDLYASRYWALRTMLETGYDGESPIADPDLAMEHPDRFDDLSAPRLVGRNLDDDLLESLYSTAPEQLLVDWYER